MGKGNFKPRTENVLSWDDLTETELFFILGSQNIFKNVSNSEQEEDLNFLEFAFSKWCLVFWP